jgi:hypothetical protein
MRVCRETLAAVAHGGNPQDRAADAYALPPPCPMPNYRLPRSRLPKALLRSPPSTSTIQVTIGRVEVRSL